MTKFLLVDQSLKDFIGHHYEYARRVLGSATRFGLKPILATHRNFSPLDENQFQIIPVFRHTYWENATYQLPFRWLRVRRDASTALQILVRPLGVRILRAREVRPRQLREIAKFARVIVPFRTPFYIGVGLSVWVWAWRRSKELVINARVWRWLARVGGLLLAPFVAATYLLAVLLFMLVRPLLQRLNREQRFARDLEAALKRAELSAGDHVFIPTLGPVEIIGLVQLLRRKPSLRRLKWSLLFRRNIFSGYRSSFVSQQEELREWRLLFDYLQRNSAGAEVRLFTDTESLAEQYQLQSSLPFTVLPVPVDEILIGAHAGKSAALRVSYIGDARDEKGYQLLPRMVRDLRGSYLSQGEAIVRAQSNFNVEGGEPATVIAHALLSAEPPNQVELVYGPFATEAYQQLLLDSDIVLAAYNPTDYASRSSATFLEALAAGIPCVTTAGSWMARLVDPKRQAFLRRVFFHPPSVRLLKQTRVTGTQLAAGSARGPSGATHVLFRLPLTGLDHAEFLGVHLQTFDRFGVPLRSKRELSAIRNCGDEVLLPFEIEGCHNMTWGIISDAGSSYFVDAYKVLFFKAPTPLPLGFGAITCGFDADMVSQAVAHVIDHYPHFKRTARELGKGLKPLYLPELLIERLLGVDAAQAQKRLVPRRHRKRDMAVS